MKLQEQTQGGGQRYTFWCPGCRATHDYLCGVADRPSWQFNGDTDRPTFSPSLLMQSGHFVPSHKPGDACWCTWRDEQGKPAPFACVRCHLFLRNGRLEFLGDCTHALAGQTVDLPDLPPSEAP